MGKCMCNGMTLERKWSGFEVKMPYVALESIESQLLKMQIVGRLPICMQKLTPKNLSDLASTAHGLRPQILDKSTLAGPGEASTGKKKAKTDQKSVTTCTFSVYEIQSVLFRVY